MCHPSLLIFGTPFLIGYEAILSAVLVLFLFYKGDTEGKDGPTASQSKGKRVRILDFTALHIKSQQTMEFTVTKEPKAIKLPERLASGLKRKC